MRNIDDVLIRKQQLFVQDLALLVDRIRTWMRSPIILGGSGFSIFPKELLALSNADFGICGPGESSLLALLQAVLENAACECVPGLVFRREGTIRLILRTLRHVDRRVQPAIGPRLWRLITWTLAACSTCKPNADAVFPAAIAPTR